MGEKIFQLCVNLMIELGRLTGTTYREINVIVFCIIGPVVFMTLLLFTISLYLKLKRLKASYESNIH